MKSWFWNEWVEFVPKHQLTAWNTQKFVDLLVFCNYFSGWVCGNWHWMHFCFFVHRTFSNLNFGSIPGMSLERGLLVHMQGDIEVGFSLFSQSSNVTVTFAASADKIMIFFYWCNSHRTWCSSFDRFYLGGLYVYNDPLHLVFVGFKTTFNWVELWAILRGLDKVRVDFRYRSF